MTTDSHKKFTRKVVAALAVLLLLPALFFVLIELGSHSEGERLLNEIYTRQLDVVLFSVNQYAWDVADSWMGQLQDIVSANRDLRSGKAAAEFVHFYRMNEGISSVFFTDTTLKSISVLFARNPETGIEDLMMLQPLESLRRSDTTVRRAVRFAATGYRKIESVDGARAEDPVMLVAALKSPAQYRICVIIPEPEVFISRVLASRMNEAAGTDFIMSVRDKRTGRTVAATSHEQFSPGASKPLWLFKRYEAHAGLKGASISDLITYRRNYNLTLFGVVFLVAAGGTYLVYRSVRKEMELARMKSDFVSNVSHELRTPLSLIRMFAETLQMGRAQTEEKRQEYYSTIVQETERLTHLVNNVLNFSRIESGKKQYHFREVHLTSIVKHVLSSYEQHIGELGFTLDRHLVENLPHIWADPDAVMEALINVIDNAVKFSARGGTIRIATGTIPGRVFVEVQDQGIGIPKEYQEKIFDKFYRVSSGLTSESKGSGLGLTLVKHIVDAHNGEVSVESDVGKGALFRLSFPLKQ